MQMNQMLSRADLYKLQTQRNDLKQHADKIIQGIKKIGPSHARRAIWELFQNAVDLSPSCEISINITADEFVFSHNGVPFTMQTLDCLFTQVSSKTLTEKKIERKEGEPVGQYGTGFMTAHSFGDVVKVSGAIKDDFEGQDFQMESPGHVEFKDLVIDRSTQDWEILCDEIGNLRNLVSDLLNQPLSMETLPDTVFKFSFNNDINKNRAYDAIESLKTILPYVMIFNERLKKVNVIDAYGNKTTYVKYKEEPSIGNCYTRTIQIDSDPKKIYYLKTDKLIIILPFQLISEDKGALAKAEPLSGSLPRLFLFYPLIGTEDFGFHFIIHSNNFQPTEPRDGLHLKSENEKNNFEEEANQKLIQTASDLIFDFLEKNLPRIESPHLLAEINFAVTSDDMLLNEYFKGLKNKWIAKFRSLPFVETLTGRISAQEAVFLDSSVIDGTEPSTLKAIYDIVGMFYPNIPKLELLPIWTKLTNEWNVTDLARINFSNIAEKIQGLRTMASFYKPDLILLYKEMIRKTESELFINKALLPNINGQFKKQGELSRSVNLNDELITIADVLNPKISNRQIDEEFLLEGLEFEPFGRRNYMELVNASLDAQIKDTTRSHNLPEHFLTKLIHYASIVSKEDSTSAPARVIKLIAIHYNILLNQIVLPTLQSDDNIDVRKGQFDLFKVFLNDISDKDDEWVKANIDNIAKVLNEAFSYTDIKKLFLRYDVYPNQLYKLRPITSLNKDNRIPEFVKVLYDKVVENSEPVKAKLAHTSIENLHNEMKPTDALDLTRAIEQRFFGSSGNEVHMEGHPFKADIIDIIRQFKQDQALSETYVRLFSATFRNKSAILVQLADGEASFTILSQNDAVIKKLAGIAGHPDLDKLIKLGEDALLNKKQEEAEMKHKKKIGNHLEDILLERLSKNIDAKVKSVQDGQDIVIYVDGEAVYFVEVKSKWLETTPIRISRNQTLQAYKNPNCFALCSIDMTKYTGEDKYEVESIDSLLDFMKINTDIGSKVGHLIDIYENAHQQDKFSLDGDYRTLIPAAYIKEGLDLPGFETIIVDRINSEQAKRIH